MFNNQSKMDMRLATTRQREGVGLPVRFKPGTHRWMRTFPTFQVEEDEVGMACDRFGHLLVVRWPQGWGLAFPRYLEIVKETT